MEREGLSGRAVGGHAAQRPLPADGPRGRRRAGAGARRVVSFDRTLRRHRLPPLDAATIDVLQVNLGKLCNQACAHCHVEAGPDGREALTRPVAEQCLETLSRFAIQTLDLTGGAPELNPNFRWLVEQARGMGRRVIDRCNLTVLLLPSQHDLVDFLAGRQVEIVASLPCFRSATTDAQRGAGVFARSIEALRRLNSADYGRGGLRLTLVHNPPGAVLPGGQPALEREYRRALDGRFGIVFDELFTIVNMPIGRFRETLARCGGLESYMRLLVRHFSAEAAQAVMCRDHLSVGWDGTLYDCDFNQALGLRVHRDAPQSLADLLASGAVARRIATGPHCFGCTAGAGSSCVGSLIAES